MNIDVIGIKEPEPPIKRYKNLDDVHNTLHCEYCSSEKNVHLKSGDGDYVHRCQNCVQILEKQGVDRGYINSRLVNEQKGVCMCCQKTPDEVDQVEDFCMDHFHHWPSDRDPRNKKDVICKSCNTKEAAVGKVLYGENGNLCFQDYVKYTNHTVLQLLGGTIVSTFDNQHEEQHEADIPNIVNDHVRQNYCCVS